jgi:hypothetical protein
MPCFTQLKPNQTKQQRASEVKHAAELIDKLIASKRVQIKVGKQGAVAFVGIPDNVRDGMTDTCVFNALKNSRSAATRIAFQKAQQLAGRPIDTKMVAQGVHSHDGGVTWHPKG